MIDIFQKWWWLIFGGLGGGIYVLIEAKKRSTAMQHSFDRMLLRLPVIGVILNKGAIARLSPTLSTQFATRLSLA